MCADYFAHISNSVQSFGGLHSVKEVPYSLCGKYRPLMCFNNKLYASQGHNIYIFNDDLTYQLRARFKAPKLLTWLAYYRLSNRIGRLGFHAITIGNDGLIVGVVKGRIVYCSSKSTLFETAMKIKRGSRPLNICTDSNGYFCFGEYFSNPNREPVNIYGSCGGKDWDIVYQFPKGSIRHIHGIYYDSYKKGFWVLTGDKDNESGLWFTDDQFSTLSPLAHGTQKARAISIIPTKHGLIVPMDTPVEENYIQYFDFKKRYFVSLKKITGSAFSAAKVGDVMFVATAVEPSLINLSQEVSLYASLDGENWHCINKFPRVFSIGLDKYLGYPQLTLALTHNSDMFLYGYAIGLKGLDGKCLRWAIKDVRSRLHAVRKAPE